MARYQVDKNRYEEFLVGTTMISCSIGTEDILIDTDSDKDLILTIDTSTAFLRIRNNDNIVFSSYMLFQPSELQAGRDEQDYNTITNEQLEKSNKAIKESIIGKMISNVKSLELALIIKFEDGMLLEVFKACESEDNLPYISLLSGTKI